MGCVQILTFAHIWFEDTYLEILYQVNEVKVIQEDLQVIINRTKRLKNIIKWHNSGSIPVLRLSVIKSIR